MVPIIFVFIVSSIILSAIGIAGLKKEQIVRQRLPSRQLRSQEMRIKFLLPKLMFFSQNILIKLKLEERIKDELDSAHIKLAPEEFFSIKIFIMLVLGLCAFFFIGKNLWAVLVAVALGYIGPDLWAKRKVYLRRQTIARVLPETVDLLGLCVEVGLDLTTAIKWVVEKISANPLMEEFVFVLEEIKWGKSRSQALKDMSKRLSLPEVSSFVQILVQAERMGTPVAEAFSAISEDSRLRRFHRGERIALQAPVKILIPLIFCILPVIAIVVGGPTVLQFVSGNLFKGF